MSNKYSFYYPGAGVAAARKYISILIIFKTEPSSQDRKKLLKGRPEALDGYSWNGRVLEISHDDDSLAWVVSDYKGDPKEPKGDQANTSQWKEFNEDIDRYLMACHKVSPIFAVVKPLDAEYWTTFSKWHEWSMEKAPEYFPELEKLFKPKFKWHLTNLAWMWHLWFKEQTLAKKKNIINNFPKELLALFSKLLETEIKAEEKNNEKVKLPTAEEAYAQWKKSLKQSNPVKAFNDYYDKKFENNSFYTLSLWSLLEEKKKWKEIKELAEVAYKKDESASPSDLRYKYVWWQPILAQAYLHLGDVKLAEKHLAESLINFSTHQYHALEVLVEWYEVNKDKENVAIVLHGAKRALGVSLSGPAVKAPKDLDHKFDEILNEWMSKAWDLRPKTYDKLFHIEYLLEKICANRGKSFPKLSKKWKEIQKERSEALEKIISQFYSNPGKLTDAELPYVFRHTLSNPQLIKDEKMFQSLLKLSQRLEVKTLFSFISLIRKERSVEDLINAIKKLNIIGKLKSGGKESKDFSLILADVGYNLARNGKPKEALKIFDLIIGIPNLDLSVYNNALWAVMHDNNKLPLNKDLERKYLKACLPYGPQNPSIFYNAACVYFELGEIDKVFENIKLAIKHRYPKIDQMKREPLFDPIKKDPRFKAAFGNPSKKSGWVVYNGVKMQSDFVEDILAAQKHKMYEINGKKYKRITFGKENYKLNIKKPCTDCAVIKGQYHVQGCDVEQCPRCGRQRLSCNCGYSDDVN